MFAVRSSQFAVRSSRFAVRGFRLREAPADRAEALAQAAAIRDS